MVKLSEEAKKNKRAYDLRYAHENYKKKLVTFNTKRELDIKLFAWASIQPEGSNAYIKRLIGEDMEKRQNV